MRESTARAREDAPSCALEEAGLARQRERYRSAGAGARVIERSRRRLVLELSERADARQVEELVAIERECCPFFELSWQPAQRRLAVAVSREAEETALEAIAFALGLQAHAPADRAAARAS
jgi:hypothetical protein